MAAVSISKAWDGARAVIARDGKLMMAVALALIVLPQVIAGVVAPPVPGSETSSQVAGLIATLISLAGQLALIRLAIGPSITVGEAIGHGFRRFPVLLATTILIAVGAFLLLIPVAVIATLMGMPTPSPGQAPSAGLGLLILVAIAAFLLISPRLLLIAPVVSAEPIGPVRAIRRSWALTGKSYWRFLALVLLLVVLALVLLGAAGLVGGTIGRLVSRDMAAFSLGAVVVSLFAALAQAVFTVMTSTLMARLYLQVAGGQDHADVSVPHAGG